MNGIGTYMMRDHKACDEYFAQADDAMAAADWARVTRSLAVFVAALERHFELEEQILFPAFEESAGMPWALGPAAASESCGGTARVPPRIRARRRRAKRRALTDSVRLVFFSP